MLHIYHPNKSNTGFACSFWYSDRERCVFATILKQAGWDDKADNGLFKGSLEDPEKHVNIKLSDMECGAILDCIERNRPFSSFHDNEEKPKAINFSPWMGKSAGGLDEESKPVQRGFSFSVSVNKKADNSKNPFYVGLTFAEARIVREFLIFAIQRRFTQLSNASAQRFNTKSAPAEAQDTKEASTPAPKQDKDII